MSWVKIIYFDNLALFNRILLNTKAEIAPAGIKFMEISRMIKKSFAK